MGAALEQSAYASGGGPGVGSTADYVWTLALGCAVLLTAGWALGFAFLGGPLLMYIVYLWSRKFPDREASLWFFRMPGALLPWAMVGLNFILGGDPVPDLLGIGAAHVYYYIVEVLPKARGSVLADARAWLKTPAALSRAFGVPPTGLSALPPGAGIDARRAAAAAAAAGRPDAFRGVGHALGGR
jgi:hypothetical protein